MRFDFITIFPEMFGYLNQSILGRAQKNKLIDFKIHNLRDFTTDNHKTVDDKPYGGGPGMVMAVKPIYRALRELRVFESSSVRVKKDSQIRKFANSQTQIILLSAKGKQFSHADAVRLAKKYKQLIFICGRYEGVDERVAKYIADEEISIGPYVLTGGELPAMVIADAVARHIPGVLGKTESLLEESYSQPNKLTKLMKLMKLKNYREYPQYTRPEIFSPQKGTNWRVPKILLSGDHKKIKEWRDKK